MNAALAALAAVTIAIIGMATVALVHEDGSAVIAGIGFVVGVVIALSLLGMIASTDRANREERERGPGRGEGGG